MVNKLRPKKKAGKQTKASGRSGGSRASSAKKPIVEAKPVVVDRGISKVVQKSGNHSKTTQAGRRQESLRQMLLAKRQEVMNDIRGNIGQSLTEDQMRRLEGMDSGDQAMMDLERELGISLSEMRNRQRQMIDDALIRVEEGSYGICAECGVEISEKRLAAVPFAKLCVECQTQAELLERIEKEEERD